MAFQLEPLVPAWNWQERVFDTMRAQWKSRGYTLGAVTGRESDKFLLLALNPWSATRSNWNLRLQIYCYQNPFDSWLDEEAVPSPLICFSLHGPVPVRRAVITRSPEIMTTTVDEMIEELKRQLAAESDEDE